MANRANQEPEARPHAGGYPSGGLTPIQRDLVRLTVDFGLGAVSDCADLGPPGRSRLGSAEELTAILSGRACSARRRLDVLHAFAEEAVRTRGHPSSGSLHAFLAAGFSRSHVMDVMREVTLRTTSAMTATSA